jgi:hypothetical protein
LAALSTIKVMTGLGYSDSMGPRLRAFVEEQLVADLRHYGVSRDDLTFDWSESCIEGHRMTHLDGAFENYSGVQVLGGGGEVVADGWMDFIEGGDGRPPVIFWNFLTLVEGGLGREVKNQPGLPQHVWQRLPDTIKEWCVRAGQHDPRYSNDPTVRRWKNQREGKVGDSPFTW